MGAQSAALYLSQDPRTFACGVDRPRRSQRRRFLFMGIRTHQLGAIKWINDARPQG